jgi:hypothetical protein
MTPFEVVYGHVPPTLHRYEIESTVVAQVEASFKECDEILRSLKENLIVARNRMKISADCHRREQVFEIGDLVYLKL